MWDLGMGIAQPSWQLTISILFVAVSISFSDQILAQIGQRIGMMNCILQPWIDFANTRCAQGVVKT